MFVAFRHATSNGKRTVIPTWAYFNHEGSCETGPVPWAALMVGDPYVDETKTRQVLAGWQIDGVKGRIDAGDPLQLGSPLDYWELDLDGNFDHRPPTLRPPTPTPESTP